MNTEVIEQLKNAAMRRRLDKAAEDKIRREAERQHAEAEWVRVLTQVYRDWPALVGCIDETCPNDWVGCVASVEVNLPKHTTISLSYSTRGTGVWGMMLSANDAPFRVDTDFTFSRDGTEDDAFRDKFVADIGEALQLAEESWKKREAAREEYKKQKNAADMLEKLAKLPPTLEEKLLATFAEWVREVVETTKYTNGCDPEDPVN